MDYLALSNEYLGEAQKLKEAIVPIKNRLKQKRLGFEETISLQRRQAMLYQMYLECRFTGLYLKRHYA
ncbi:MAG: hypothetical protein LKJ50_06630 [Clostridiales bacterium]|jgi:hypothetical protein|nr:hypothetical protein [Clostridiales bacterium]MCI2160434.1 hypothetical protein [Oscillospiraceae bacterium]CAB1242846.1 conserved protein of unknown function [Ruminococcaceae bacterium BL-4]MCI2022058.1 hypothetical protein [Clostridiales bacterium]MCI2025927.1 hypothetical protein [Clostridiales bacterium]